MRKILISTLTLAMLIMAGTVYSQGYTFKVLANRGQNQVKKAGATAAVPLRTGTTLNTGDELIASSGAYIGLMHKTGKTIEVRTAGTTKVADLEKKVAAKSSSVASKYAQYLASKMNDDGSVNYRQRMNATGAVSRAIGSGGIAVVRPGELKTIDVVGDNIIVRWLTPEGEEEGVTQYEVSLKNIFDEVIFNAETDKNFIALNFKDESMLNEAGLYLFDINVKGSSDIKAEQFGIKVVKPEDKGIAEDLNDLMSAVRDDSPLNKIIYASFYEENGLILDALTKYEEAVQMAPEITQLQDLYEDFLNANGLVPEETDD